MNSTSRKIGKIEENVLSLPNDEEIVLYVEDNAERILHEKAEQIKQKYREDAEFLHDHSLTFEEICSRAEEMMKSIPESELLLMKKSHAFARYRVMRLVYKQFEFAFGRNKNQAWMRIVWFFDEMKKLHTAEAMKYSEFTHNRNEENPDFDEDKWWELLDEKINLLYPEGVFTEKSWEKCRDFFDAKVAEFVKKYYEEHPEELEELKKRLK